jgi:hypothetical protein
MEDIVEEVTLIFDGTTFLLQNTTWMMALV